MSTAGMRPAVFLDRDGVLNELVEDPLTGVCESPLQVADVRLMPGAANAVVRLRELGYLLVCVTNQPAAAKGQVTAAQLGAVHERVLELLLEQGAQLTATRMCMHHELGVVTELSGRCACRKPAPGMLLDAAGALNIDLAASFMVGDTDADVAAGRAAGCTTILIENPRSIHKRLQGISPHLRASSLIEAVQYVTPVRLETV